MDYVFCFLHIEEFWKMAIPIIWCYMHLQSPNSTLRILFLTFISTHVFYLLSLDLFLNVLLQTVFSTFHIKIVYLFSKHHIVKNTPLFKCWKIFRAQQWEILTKIACSINVSPEEKYNFSGTLKEKVMILTSYADVLYHIGCTTSLAG
jgi:hypothetical protein